MTAAHIFMSWMTNQNNDYEKYRIFYDDETTVELSYYRDYGWVFEDTYLYLEGRYVTLEIQYDVLEEYKKNE